MPRHIVEEGVATKPRLPALTAELADEIKAARTGGQPTIIERRYHTGRVAVTVIWDKWHGVPAEERSRVIVQAYEAAEGKPFTEKIAVAVGYTTPEAHAAGLLPYAVVTALRKTDPVTFQQCWDAMLAEGASKLFGPNVLQLRFSTEEEAQAAVRRLSEQLPGSEPIWQIQIDPAALLPETD